VKSLRKTIFGIAAVFVLAAAGGMFYLIRGLAAGSQVTVNAVNPAALGDGTYAGEYRAGRWSNTVQVTVREGRMTEIQVVKDVIFPKPAVTAEILDRVMTAQSPAVDAVTGSTVTCKAYLKAIENALTPR
jgi:uncharacterized protein with FMN-binding domain